MDSTKKPLFFSFPLSWLDQQRRRHRVITRIFLMSLGSEREKKRKTLGKRRVVCWLAKQEEETPLSINQTEEEGREKVGLFDDDEVRQVRQKRKTLIPRFGSFLTHKKGLKMDVRGWGSFLIRETNGSDKRKEKKEEKRGFEDKSTA